MNIKQQKEILERRILEDRRKAIRPSIDRRTPTQLNKDNQFVSNWMSSFQELKSND